jgi:hypothetical protein
MLNKHNFVLKYYDVLYGRVSTYQYPLIIISLLLLLTGNTLGIVGRDNVFSMFFFLNFTM